MGGRYDVEVGVLGGCLDYRVVIRSRRTFFRRGHAVIFCLEGLADYAGDFTGRSARRRLGSREIESLVSVDGIDGPADAQVQSVCDVNLDDQGFDEHLGPRYVEFLDDRYQCFVGLLARLNDQGVGGGIRAEGDALGERGDLGSQVLHLAPGGSGPSRRRARAFLA